MEVGETTIIAKQGEFARQAYDSGPYRVTSFLFGKCFVKQAMARRRPHADRAGAR